MSGQHGRWAAVELTPTVIEDIWTVPTGYVATININICNTGDPGVDAPVDVALVDGPCSAVTDEDWIFWQMPVPYTCEKTAIVLNQGQSICARSSAAGVNVVIWGFVQPCSSGLPC